MVDQNSVVSFIPITILGGDSSGFWIGGLPQTVTVITVGQDYVVEGQKVDVVMDDSTETAPVKTVEAD